MQPKSLTIGNLANGKLASLQSQSQKKTQNLTIQGSNGISNIGPIGAIGGGSSPSLWGNDIFSIDEQLPHELVRKYEIYESTEDLLALSCAWYRLRNTARDSSIPHVGLTITKLLDRSLFHQVTDDDRTLANTIRDYYSKKVMMWKLKNITMSKFRNDLNEFVHSDGKKFTESYFGMVYRLPQFYFYDIKLDEIFHDRNRVTKKVIPNHFIKTLNFIDFTKIDRKAIKRNEYWFYDEDNNLVSVNLAHDNPLLKIWEQIIEGPIKLQGLFYNRRKDDFEYYQAEKYNLVM